MNNLAEIGIPDSAFEHGPERLSPSDNRGHGDFWLNASPELADITLSIPDACVDEFDAVLKRLPEDVMANGAAGQESLLDDAMRQALFRSSELAAEVRHQLDNAPGAILLDRFPAERHSDDANRTMCGLFSSLVAPLMPQNFEGTTLYDVMDKKVTDGSQVRRSITNLAQDYHTDGGWVPEPARYVGLYCIRAAQTGGYSRITSILSASDAIKASGNQTAAAELARSHPWDRQGEHSNDDLPYEMHPVIVEREGEFLSRFYADYVINGYRKKGEAISESTAAALASLQVQLDRQPSIRFLLEAGQYQYVNNYTIVHAREAFDDVPDPVGGRRLIRVWNY